MPGRSYDFWLLDLDGTIVDVESSYIHDVMGRVADRLGVDFSPAEAERLWYEDETDRNAVLETHGVDHRRFWTTFHEIEDAEARAEATYVYDDAATVVPTIDAPVGLVTHCQPYLTEPILAHLDITDWFDTVVCCGDDVGWKPDPRPVELAMAELGVGENGHDGVLVGDAPSDLAAARNAGLEAVHVARGRGRPVPTPEHGHRRVETLGELAD